MIISGSCGESCVFALDEDGLLKITGTGKMYDYNDRSKICPWYDYKQKIFTVEVSDEVEHIGAYTFRCSRNLSKIIIGESVKTIGDYAVDHCNHLRIIEGMTGVVNIQRNAFEFCDIDTMTLPDTLEIIGVEAFRYNSNLLTVKIPESVTSIGVAAFIGMQRDFELVGTTPAVIDYCKHNSCHYCAEGDEGKERH